MSELDQLAKKVIECCNKIEALELLHQDIVGRHEMLKTVVSSHRDSHSALTERIEALERGQKRGVREWVREYAAGIGSEPADAATRCLEMIEEVEK